MKYNIAIIGTFNVENYGDLLFPDVFKMSMQKRGLDFETFMFSPEFSGKKALDDSSYVYSTDRISEVDAQSKLDAVVIGGGAIIHFNNIYIKFPGNDYFSNYNTHDAWYTAIEYAVRNNVKVLYNLPQIPLPFPNQFKQLAKTALSCSNYISVRDDASKDYAKELFADDETAPEIKVYPDAVCCLPSLVSSERLQSIRNQLGDFSKKYAIVQFNHGRPKDQDKGLVDSINLLKEKGYEVVLLPIGYTHNDDVVLAEFDKKYQLNCRQFDKKLNIWETAAVLEGCDVYIGSSFHGAVTSIAYGKKAISYNYISPPDKNIELFKQYGVSEFVAENAEQVYEKLAKLLNGEMAFCPKIQEVSNLVEEHFDNLYREITVGETVKNDYNEFVKPLLKSLAELSTLEATRKENELLKNYNEQLVSAVLRVEEDNRRKQALIESLSENINALTTTNASVIAPKPSLLKRIKLKIRKFLSRHNKLLKICIYSKGFLKGGFKGAKRSVQNYNETLKDKNVETNENK